MKKSRSNGNSRVTLGNHLRERNTNPQANRSAKSSARMFPTSPRRLVSVSLDGDKAQLAGKCNGTFYTTYLQPFNYHPALKKIFHVFQRRSIIAFFYGESLADYLLSYGDDLSEVQMACNASIKELKVILAEYQPTYDQSKNALVLTVDKVRFQIKSNRVSGDSMLWHIDVLKAECVFECDAVFLSHDRLYTAGPAVGFLCERRFCLSRSVNEPLSRQPDAILRVLRLQALNGYTCDKRFIAEDAVSYLIRRADKRKLTRRVEKILFDSRAQLNNVKVLCLSAVFPGLYPLTKAHEATVSHFFAQLSQFGPHSALANFTVLISVLLWPAFSCAFTAEKSHGEATAEAAFNNAYKGMLRDQLKYLHFDQETCKTIKFIWGYATEVYPRLEDSQAQMAYQLFYDMVKFAEPSVSSVQDAKSNEAGPSTRDSSPALSNTGQVVVKLDF